MQTMLRACAVLLCAASATSLTEEMSGVNDWKVQNIGRVKALVHPAAKSGIQRSKAFVITDAFTVASIDLNTGETVWRQTLAESEPIDSVRLSGRTLVTLSGNGRYVRAWNAQDGSLLWDNVLCERGGGAHTFDALLPKADVDGDSVSDVVLLCDNMLQVRAGSDGNPQPRFPQSPPSGAPCPRTPSPLPSCAAPSPLPALLAATVQAAHSCPVNLHRLADLGRDWDLRGGQAQRAEHQREGGRALLRSPEPVGLWPRQLGRLRRRGGRGRRRSLLSRHRGVRPAQRRDGVGREHRGQRRRAAPAGLAAGDRRRLDGRDGAGGGGGGCL